MLTGPQILAMTDEEIRVEMARADGWTVEPLKFLEEFKASTGKIGYHIQSPKWIESHIHDVDVLPNYTHDIELMYDFEEKHIKTEIKRYIYVLALATLVNHNQGHQPIEKFNQPWYMAHATPDERCRAFLMSVLMMKSQNKEPVKE